MASHKRAYSSQLFLCDRYFHMGSMQRSSIDTKTCGIYRLNVSLGAELEVMSIQRAPRQTASFINFIIFLQPSQQVKKGNEILFSGRMQ